MYINIPVFLFLFLIVKADIYMHNPRGSNNRLNENARERNNANRLFDSQNNNRGGYNVGSLYYYEGSALPIEWTNQHSCHTPNNDCNIIIQYMCHENLRDGAVTTTIPESPMQCENYDCNTDKQYGMHEDFDYYVNCKLRQRNMGIFTADQKLNLKNARSTRQNPDGTRRGYECPEERDYYPYWHPTPWKDIAVLTNDTSRCAYYEAESENVKSRWECVLPRELILMELLPKNIIIPSTKEECEAFVYPKINVNGTYGVWTEFPSHGLPPPECLKTQLSRDNHLGNTIGGNPNSYNWTIPFFTKLFPERKLWHERCVLRIRYNISTGDFDGWSPIINASLNKLQNSEGSLINLGAKINFQPAMANKRGFIFKKNPAVKIFTDIDLFLELAIDTAQYGRVFQDRSHIFSIRKRPADMDDMLIHNVNVRGKRGNIVQVYPAVEYDYVPVILEVSKNDYIHFQWTGSNSNPQNNDGQGLAGSDRSNIVIQEAEVFQEESNSSYGPGNKFGHWGRNYPAHLSNVSILGLSKDDIISLAFLGIQQQGNIAELDDAGTYFDLGPRKITSNGTFYYMCSRNNNFSNRSQKGKICSYEYPVRSKTIGRNGGNCTVQKNEKTMGIFVDLDTFNDQYLIQLETWPEAVGKEKMSNVNAKLPDGTNVVSDFLLVQPEHQLTTEGKTFRIDLIVKDGQSRYEIYRSTSKQFATWQRLDVTVESNVARFYSERGGVFVACTSTGIGLTVGMVLMVLALLILTFSGIYYFRRHPDNLQKIRDCCGRSRQSLKNSI